MERRGDHQSAPFHALFFLRIRMLTKSLLYLRVLGKKLLRSIVWEGTERLSKQATNSLAFESERPWSAPAGHFCWRGSAWAWAGCRSQIDGPPDPWKAFLS